MRNALWIIAAGLILSACGGGGGGSSGGGATVTPPTLTNFASVTVDAGPAAVNTGPNAYISDDAPFVSVTICAPGSTTNCQTIDHVLVDTGSVGLRIAQSVLNSSLLSALPSQMDASSSPVGECYGFVDGYVFGSVRSADFQIGGESVSGMPLQLIGDGGAFANPPSSCSSGGGTSLSTVQEIGANGIIGIGVTTTDCGSLCETAGGYSAAIYYDCPTSGCSSIITRNASTSAPFQQLPNPVAAMGVDNNGTILELPTVPPSGEISATGTLYFGIGTQANNGLGAQSILTTTNSNSPYGPGLLTAAYKGQTLPESFIDSGSNAYYFIDSTIALCAQAGFAGFYCPSSPLSLGPTLSGSNGVSASAAFTLYNAYTLLEGTNSAAAGIGANPNAITNADFYPNSFDFGLPFFFGRNVYTALEGRSAGTTVGPYMAF